MDRCTGRNDILVIEIILQIVLNTIQSNNHDRNIVISIGEDTPRIGR